MPTRREYASTLHATPLPMFHVSGDGPALLSEHQQVRKVKLRERFSDGGKNVRALEVSAHVKDPEVVEINLHPE